MTPRPDRTRPPEPGTPAATPMPLFERLEGTAGPTLFAARRTSVPLVELELLLDAGGAHNPLLRPGLAAMTAAMIDEGSVRRSGPEIAAELEGRGGALSSGADWNAARIRLQLLASDLVYGVELLAELVQEPAFPQHELDRLRQQALAERRRRADQPAALADEAFAHHLYAATVYAHPLQGTREALESLGREELVAFHGERYRARGVPLVAAGDFDFAALAAAAARAFGPSGEPVPVSVAPAGAPSDARQAPPALRVVVVDRPGAEQTELRIGHLGVPRRDPDRVGLGVLNTLLGGKFTSRINLNLRERHGFTYGASSRFVDRKSRGPFLVSTAVTTSAVGRAASEILSELSRLREEPVAAEELDATRSYLIGAFPYGLQTIEGLAARLDEIALYDLPLDTPARHLAEVAAIRPEEIGRLARIHLRPDEALVVAVGPAEVLVAELKGIAEPELWRPAE